LSVQQKKAMTSVDIKAWIEENSGKLSGARVQNIYFASDQKVALFKLKIDEYKYLLIEPGRRIYLTRFPIEHPESPSLTALSFRKHLREEIIDRVEQIGFDRIVKISFRNGFSIYAEILPRGEIVLVDTDGRIVQATEFKSMKDREIKRGRAYSLPPIIAKPPSVEECIERAKGGSEASISRELGIPPELLIEAERRGKSSPEEKCREVMQIVSEAGKKGGFVVLRGGVPLSFHPFQPTIADSEDEVVAYERFNDAVDDFYFKISSSMEGKMSEEEVRLSKLIQEVEREIEQNEKRAVELYEQAKVLMSRLEDLRELRRCIEDAREKFGWEGIAEHCPNIVKIDASKGKATIKIDGKEADIPINRDPYSFIQEMFEEAKKLKKKAESAKQHLAELRSRLKDESEKRLQKLELMKAAYRKKSWYERFRWSFTRSGFLVIAGRELQQNMTIVRKYLKEEDIYLHADIHGAPSTVLLSEGKTPSEEDIYDAAVIAASYSRAWSLGLPSVDVFWVKGNQVSLSPPSGEYLSKGSFMIYGQKNYVKGVRLILYIGIQQMEDGSLRPFVGSEESAKKNSIPVAYIVPGEQPPEEALKKLIAIGKKNGMDLGPLSEDIKLILPGKCRVFPLPSSHT